MLRLALRYQEQIRYFPMPDRDVQLGAGMENDLIAPFPGISRHHAKLHPEGAGVLVTDLGSTNGLVRDGRRLDEVLLTPGKGVRLGHAVLALEDLSSSDGETGLRFQTPVSHGAAGPLATDTAALSPAAGSSPAAALRFVRELERNGIDDPADRLGRARRALGARSLLVLDLGFPDDPAVVACEGPLPSEPRLGDLATADVGTLLSDTSGGACLIALFDAAPEPWQQDFFSYLGDKLLQTNPAIQPKSPSAEEDLRLPPGMVVGTSAAMQDLLAQLRAMARSDLSILLTGETGTGKELFARLIHDSGLHARGSFVAVNCAAIPAELLEYELFGIGSRVATGVDQREGFFVQAHGGTLFLDEIGDMPERLQAKLLRALQEREVLPLGGTVPRKIDARIVAASNRDLGRLVKEGLFRADLFYRLRGIELRLPPLRERRDDLPTLLLAFASRAAAKYGKRVHGVSRRALSALLAHDWPGNVRELEAAVERAVLLCPDGGSLQREHFGTLEHAADESLPSAPPPPHPDPPVVTGTLQEQVDAVEREAILRALATAEGNKSKAARLLGITRNGLSLKMDRLKISRGK
ncbi:MAG TPA: sigma 54-dependent Fis family transcriptional regulator [Thermoanaerobaculia bacterium]|jgi:DNA-binding NtrC family response regulator|nr:sigma 54-dependent Fis family transcriptional regulator [Thermoanaerobaculia bacterium]